MTHSAQMFLRPHQRSKDGKDHTYWSLVETVRTTDGPRQRTLCYLGELNGSAQARWLKSIEVFNEQGASEQLKLFPAHVEVPDDDPQVARVLVNRVRLERTRQFGSCFLGWKLWKQLGLDHFFEQAMDEEAADVPWSRIAAVLAINRLTRKHERPTPQSVRPHDPTSVRSSRVEPRRVPSGGNCRHAARRTIPDLAAAG